MFILDSFLLLFACMVFLVGVLVFNFSVLFFKYDKMLFLFFGYGFLLASVTLFVCSYLLLSNLFMKF